MTLYQSTISVFCYYNFCPLRDPVKRVPILDQFFYDYYTLSQSKWLESHTLSSGTYPYSQYTGVPPPPGTTSPYKHPIPERSIEYTLKLYVFSHMKN